MDDKYKNCPIIGCRVECGSKICKKIRIELGIDDEPQNTQTNGDHMRSMGDEQLAEWLVRATGYQEYPFTPMIYINFLTGPDDDIESAIEGTKEWLKQPAEDGK